jgi:hypothetical protein
MKERPTNPASRRTPRIPANHKTIVLIKRRPLFVLSENHCSH